MPSLKDMLLGGACFGEDEEHFSFKFRFLFVLTLFGALTSGIFLIGHQANANSMGLIHSKMQALHVGICLFSILLLYGRKQMFTWVAWLNAVFSLLLFTSAFLFVPQDELRILWFFLSLPLIYLLLGSLVGTCATALSIVLVVALNGRSGAPYSSHALITAVVGFIYLASVFHAFSSRSISYYEKLVESKQTLRHLSRHDALTGLLNLRAYRQACDQVVSMALRSRDAISILFVDLDHFKRINDTHGHAVGDAVLKAVAACLQREIRGSDVIGRIGGEEFSVLLPNTDQAGGLNLAEKLRAAIEGLEIQTEQGFLRMTASIGVATRTSGQASFQEIQDEADEAMYRAKQAGRNRVSTISTPEAPSSGAMASESEWRAFKALNCEDCTRYHPDICPLPKVLGLASKGQAQVSETLDLLLPLMGDGTRRCAMNR